MKKYSIYFNQVFEETKTIEANSEEEAEQLTKSISKIQNQIEEYKKTVAYVWKYGNKMQRYGVLQSLANHFGKKIDVNELDDEIKKMLE